MKQLRVVGSISLDTNHVGTRALHKLGGVVTYAGLTARRLGAEVEVVTSIAQHDAEALERLRRAGVNVRARIGATSTRFVNQMRGDARVQWVDSMADPIEGADLPPDAAGRVLLGALHPHDVRPEVLDRLEDGASPVAADLQGWVRRIEGRAVTAAASSSLERVLRLAGVVKADLDEIGVATRALDCTEQDLCARFGIEELVITTGNRGGRIWLRSRHAVEYPAAASGEGLDSTGAGDVFLATYLVARDLRRLDPAAAARLAAAHAARQVEGRWLEDGVLALDAPA